MDEQEQKKKQLDINKKDVTQPAVDANAMLVLVKEGKMSSAEFKRLTGRKLALAGQKHYSKYSTRELIDQRQKPQKVKNLKKAEQAAKQHDEWYEKKFGKKPDETND